ncbi:hypothetical protein YdaL [Escherichia albertii NBRC 107761 = DSM 17582]|nr:hypothetical protein YdaL [Escherichia albertii NBRC 107761 = DSM 17582]
MNLDDKSLFLDAMEDVQPLKCATDVHWHPTVTNVRHSVLIRFSLIIFSPLDFSISSRSTSRWNFAGKDCNMECLISYAVANIRNRPA